MIAGDLSIFKSEKGFTLREWYGGVVILDRATAHTKLKTKYVCFIGTDVAKAIEKAKAKGCSDLTLWKLVRVEDGYSSYCNPEVIGVVE